MAKTFENEPVAIIATHVQITHDKNLLKIIENISQKFNSTYTFTKYGDYLGNHDLGGGIPQIFIFDFNGKEIYQGRGGKEMEALIQKTLAKKPPIYGPDLHFQHLQHLANKLAKRKDLGEIAVELRQKIEAPNPKISAEAKILLKVLNTMVDKELELAEEVYPFSPLEHLSRLKKLAKRYQKDTILFQSLKKKIIEKTESTQFIGDLAAEKKFQELMKFISNWSPCALCATAPMRQNTFDCRSCKKANKQLILQFKAKGDTLRKAHPKAPHTSLYELFLADFRL